MLNIFSEFEKVPCLCGPFTFFNYLKATVDSPHAWKKGGGGGWAEGYWISCNRQPQR